MSVVTERLDAVWDEFFESKFVRVDDVDARAGHRLEVQPSWNMNGWISERTSTWRKTPSLDRSSGCER